jgi:VIT1/CCC1 family predicted Fe2+/Mn2+ transporter/rubrerythrin
MAMQQDADLSASGLPHAPAVAQTSRTNRNLWMAFVEEAKANRVYLAYAMRALEEGHPEVAEVFFEVGGAETAHALGHLRVLGEVGSTHENLKRVIEEEMREASIMYPRMIRQAEAENRSDAADAFRLAFEGESRHAKLFQQAFERLRTKRQQIFVPSVVAVPGAPSFPPPAEPVEAPPTVPYDEVQHELERVSGLRRIRELVFGAQDGLISTVAISATVMAATHENSVAVIAGLASAMAGTISMTAGTYLGSRAASEMEEAEINLERHELATHPDEERAELVATYRHDGYALEEAEALADRVMLDRDLALRVMAERELGITSEIAADPRKDAAVMGASYVVGGLVPLSAYVFMTDMLAIPVSIALTLVALAGIGVVKARTAHRAVLPSVLEVVGIGAASGGLGYLLGDFLPRLLGVTST